MGKPARCRNAAGTDARNHRPFRYRVESHPALRAFRVGNGGPSRVTAADLPTQRICPEPRQEQGVLAVHDDVIEAEATGAHARTVVRPETSVEGGRVRPSSVRHIDEAGVVALEGQHDGVGRAVAVLGHDHVRLTGAR